MEFYWINRPAAIDEAVQLVLTGVNPEAALNLILSRQEHCKGKGIPQNKRIRFLSQVRKEAEQRKSNVNSPVIPTPKYQYSHETIIFHMQHW